MRKVITGAFVSLDGVMQPGGPEEDPTGGFKFGGGGGGVTTGFLGIDPPTELELARRERMRREG